MLRRKMYDVLLNWKKNKQKECLLVNGPRQCGKTYIIDKFGSQEYKKYIYINFYEQPQYKDIFEGSLVADDIYKKISIYLNNVEFEDKNTLIFLDEIQECPNARTALKFLALDDRYDVICSGSLLGIHYKKIASIPVGYEREVKMHSLDFEEFLWAIGQSEENITYIKSFFDNKQKVDEGINDLMLNRLREYMVVGGMPEAVNTFIKTKNFNSVYETQQKIINSYYYDIEKFADIADRQKIRAVLNSIPRQLNKEYTKFQYSVVEKKGSARKYEPSLEWLIDAGLLVRCYNVKVPTFPLVSYIREDSFKVYFTDIGLLTALYGQNVQKAILTQVLKSESKGGIYENLVADILNKKGISLNYYKIDNSIQEIEFLLEGVGEVIPLEVKSSNGSTTSLNNFITNYKPRIAYKLISGNLGYIESKYSLPLYMAIFLGK